MISVATLQAALPAAATADTVELGNMIERARVFIEKTTRRYFGSIETHTEYVYGTGSRVLRLKEQAVIEDTDYPEDSITVAERPWPGDAMTAIEGFLIRLQEEDKVSLLVRTGGSVWTKGYEYAVTYERGYGIDNGPPDIAQLIIDLIEPRLTTAGGEVLQSESIGGVSYTRFKETDLDLIDDGWSTIENWRRAVFA